MKSLLVTLFALGIFLLPHTSRAGDLLGEGCFEAQSTLALQATPAAYGMTCDQAQFMNKNFKALSLALGPVAAIFKSAPGKEALMDSLATYGIEVSAAAGMSVVVIGTIGIGTIYFVVSETLDECAQKSQAELRQAFEEALARRNIQIDQNTPMTVSR